MVDITNFNVVPEDEEQNFTVKFGESVRVVEKDFNKLENRPKYNNVAMTGDTNIPEVPSKLSQLTNDSDYQTGSEVDAAILVETTAREDADTTINGRIDTLSTGLGDEETARKAADKTLQDNIDAEATTRYNDDVALGNRIDGEVTARQNADISLQSQIDAITSASDVVDIVGTYAALQTYPTTGLGNNDVIKVLQDETHNDAMSYYRWSTSTSTWSYIGSEGPYYTKSEADTLLLSKQNKLTAGTNITISGDTISATDTTYTAGTGLTLAGTQFSADTSVLQEKLTAGDGITITGTTIKANIDPADFFTADGTVNGEGSEITLNNTIDAPLDDAQMKGDIKQQTYSGKNLYKIIPASGNGLTGTLTNDGMLSVTGTANNDGGSDITSVFNTNLPVGTYTFSITKTLPFRAILRGDENTNLGVIEPGGTSNTFTTTAPISSLRVFFWLVTGGTEYNETVGFQVEAGSATTFEPYTAGPAPNPDYPQTVKTVTGLQTIEVHGKNLLDMSTLTDGYVNNDGSFSPAHDKGEMRSGFIEVTPNTDYTFSIMETSSTYEAWFGVGEYSTNQTSGFVRRDTNTTITATSITITTSSTTNYIVVSARNMAGATKAQVEAGTATTYQSYQSQSYTIDLGSIELCKIGDYQDYIYKSGDDWYVHKEITHITRAIADMNNGNDYPGWGNVAELRTTIGTSINGGLSGQTSYVSNVATANTGLNMNTNNDYARLWFPRGSWGNDHTETYWKTNYPDLVLHLYYVNVIPQVDTKITDTTLISELNALRNALSYEEQTDFEVTASNLPAILNVAAYKKSLKGVLGAIKRLSA